MAHEFKLPGLGEGLTEGEVARWLVTEGDVISEGDPLVEIQTDKTTVEIPSPYAGTVLMILVAEGGVAPVGATLVVLGEEGEHLLRPVRPLPAEEPPAAGTLVVVGDEPLEATRATPSVRRLARQLGVDLLAVRGSGPAGRVTERDVRTARALSPDAGRRIPIRGIRRAIIEQVERTHREIPAVTFVEECDFTGVDRELLVASTLKAVAESLRVFPELNARIEGDEIVLLERYDLGVAVETDAGLVVPVVRDCDGLTVEEIHAEIRRLVAGAQAGTLQGDELRDSTFTVTSAGKLGGLVRDPSDQPSRGRDPRPPPHRRARCRARRGRGHP